MNSTIVLTDLETKMLQILARGGQKKELSYIEGYYCSRPTANTRMRSLREKLGVATDDSAVLLAKQMGLLD